MAKGYEMEIIFDLFELHLYASFQSLDCVLLAVAIVAIARIITAVIKAR